MSLQWGGIFIDLTALLQVLFTAKYCRVLNENVFDEVKLLTS